MATLTVRAEPSVKPRASGVEPECVHCVGGWLLCKSTASGKHLSLAVHAADPRLTDYELLLENLRDLKDGKDIQASLPCSHCVAPGVSSALWQLMLRHAVEKGPLAHMTV